MTYSEYYEQWKKQKNGSNTQEVSTSQNSSNVNIKKNNATPQTTYSDYYKQWKERWTKSRAQEEEKAKKLAPVKNIVNSFFNMSNSAKKGITQGIKKEIINALKGSTSNKQTSQGINSLGQINTPDINNIKNYNLPQAPMNTNTNTRMREINKSEISTLPERDIKLASKEETQNAQEMTLLQQQARKRAEEKNENISKGGVEAFNEVADSLLNAVPSGVMSASAGLGNVATTVGATAVKTANKLIKSDKLDDVYDDIVNSGRYINEKGNFLNNVNSQVENGVVRDTANVIHTVSQMATNAGIGAATGIPGSAVQGISVGGSSAQEVLNKDKDKIYRAGITGTAKGLVAYGIEKLFDANILTKGSKAGSIQNLVNKKIAEKFSTDLGRKVASKLTGIAGENIEEILEDNVDNVIDKLVNNKEMPGFKEWLSNTTETLKATTLSTIIADLLGLGGGNYQDITEEVQKNTEAQTWINEAQKIIQKENLGINNIINNSQPTAPINNQQNTQNQPIPPINNTQGETINWNEMERPEGKIRKHYKSIIESSNTTAEAKKIARELMGSDTYVPESNKSQIQRADKFIEKYGVEKALDRLMTNVDNNTVTFDGVFRKVGVDDIALGERLIQYYSKTGDASNLQNAILATAQAGTDAGRAVQLLSIINHQTPTGQVTWIQRSVDKMNQEIVNKRGENAPQFEFTPEMMQKILETDNQESMYKAIDEVYEELGQQVSKSKLQQIDSWRYFSMLANPKTHIRNIVGNVAMGNLQSVKNKVAGAIEGTVAQFNPNMERTHTLKRASKEVREFAKNDIKNIADSLGLNQDKYNPKSRLENSMRTFKSDAMENTLGKAFELNEKALEVEDAWGLKSGYVKALSEYMTANNLNPQTITDAQLAKARNYAIAEAKEATFHAENAIATAINQFSKKGKSAKFLTDAVLPFVKTPMNVAKAGMEYNPTGLIKTLTYDTVQLRKGNISVNKYIDNLSKGLTGTGVAVLGYALAEAGILKASGGDDDKKEKFDEAIGKQSYSLEINGKTYSLDWLAPAGIPLFVGAEAHNINKAGKNEKTSKSTDDDKRSKQIIESMENWANAMTNSMSPMAEMSMISGLTSALKSYDQDSQKMLGTIGTNAVKSYVNQFVPTALGQVAKTADDYERSTTSTAKGILPKAIDQTKLQMMSKIPGLRQQLPIKTDVWGKEQKQEGNVVEKAVKNAILPFNIKSVSNSKVDKALNELYGKTGATSILPTTSLDKTFKIDGQTYRMTNEEYNKYRKNYGQNSYKILNDLVSSNAYKSLNNEQKQKAIESIYSYTKEKNKVDYAKTNKLKVEPSTLYNTMEDLKSKGGNQSSYLQYISKTTGVEKESERNKILAESDYTPKTKSIIYSNGTGKDDDFYNLVANNTDLNITEYLNYKVQKNAKAFEADKDGDGKAISGTAKKKVFEWVNSNITGYENRLLILGHLYKLSNKERNDLTNYINKKSQNDEEAIESFKNLTKNYTYKNGKIYYK